MVLEPGEPGKDQDRRLHLGDAQRAQHIEARHIRQAEIEHDYVVIVELAEVDALLTKVRRIDVETLGFEHEVDGLRGGAIVLNYHYAHAGSLSSHLGPSLALRGVSLGQIRNRLFTDA